MSMFYLKQNHGCEIPKYILSLDTETWVDKERDVDGNVVQRLRLFSMCYSERNGHKWRAPQWFEGTTYEEAWKALDYIGKLVGEHARLWVVGHNLAFDWRVLGLDFYVTRPGWDAPKMYNTQRPFIVKVQKQEGPMYEFISSTNLYMASLEALGKEFGLEKMGKDLNMNKLDEYPHEVVAQYCHRDVEVLDLIMRKHCELVRDGNMGTFNPTTPGQAYNFWKHRFMPIDTMSVYDSPGLINIEKEAYRGGRCEVFHLGKFKDCTQVDVHSMYPWVMKKVPYPIKSVSASPLYESMESMLEHYNNGHYVIAECLLELKRPVIGVKRNDMLKFPVHRIRTVIDSPEIEYLLTHPDAGYIKDIIRFTVYEEGDVGFEKFIDHWFGIKKQYKDGDYQYRNAKLMMNSLQGKMGQRYFGEMTEVRASEADMIRSQMDDVDQDALNDSEGGTYFRAGDKILKRPGRTEKLSREAMPRIPGKICSMARMRLQELMDIAGPRHYYNCDTDSLIVDAHGLENLERAGELGSELGKLGIVDRQYEDGRKDENGKKMYYPLTGVCGEIFGNKDYIIDGLVKRKGIKKNAVEVGYRTFEQWQFVTGLNSYWDGTRFGVKVKLIRKNCNHPYTKGIVMKDSWIDPFVFHDW